jgi:hypothetical protein
MTLVPDGATVGASPAALIRRRRVIYVEGYDPQGAKGYYRLFDRSWARFLKVWPLKSHLSELALESQDFAHWDVEAAGPNWEVVTRYDFLRQEHIIRGNMAEPLLRQIPRALAWAFDYVVSGALFRVLRASPYFDLVAAPFRRRRMAGGAGDGARVRPRRLGQLGGRSDRHPRGDRDLPRAATARQPPVSDPDQQPLALSLRVRPRRGDLLRRPDRGVRATRHRGRARE